MNGQWHGQYNGSNSGLIIINLDRVGNFYQGYAYLIDENIELPWVVAYIRIPSNEKIGIQEIEQLSVISPNTLEPVDWSVAKSFFPNTTFPKLATFTFKFNNDSLDIEWKTDVGTFGSAVLPNSKASQPSALEPQPAIVDWDSFKGYVSKLDPRENLFRGQSAQWRLRTSFHRTGRSDLQRFITEDVQMLHRHLSARTQHIFDLKIPDQNGAFCNLVQHHGYPTPLLDWTYSPFVAAFFAYREVTNTKATHAKTDEKVRIYVFDQKKWRSDWASIARLTPPPLHLSVMEFIAINNERMIPQQAVSTVTNIDDIESYIIKKESEKKTRYLQAIDLPLHERSKVMKELALMGITAGSLFPGLDGACAEIRERQFY